MKCIRENCNNKAQWSSRTGYMPCKQCVIEDRKIQIKQRPEFYTLTKQHRIQEQRDQYGKDIIQPINDHGKLNRDFAEVYPDSAEEMFTQEELAKL